MIMGENNQEYSITQKMVTVKPEPKEVLNGKTPVPLALADIALPVRKTQRRAVRIPPRSIPKGDEAGIQVLQEQCKQFCLSTFFRQHEPVRSLGLTSSIAGEGRSFLSLVMAQVLADATSAQVILLECNWEHRSLHEYFDLPKTPGLAEYLRGECGDDAIRHQIGRNLAVVPAGDSKRDSVKLLQQMQQNGLLDTLASANELLVVDLPAIITTAYGVIAASLVESLVIVVSAGATSETLIAQTCAQLKDLPVEGLLLNQVRSRIPGWIQRIL
jgi:Mrp family chromosome partitioning ATPase